MQQGTASGLRDESTYEGVFIVLTQVHSQVSTLAGRGVS